MGLKSPVFRSYANETQYAAGRAEFSNSLEQFNSLKLINAFLLYCTGQMAPWRI